MYSKFSTLIKLCAFLYTKICTFLSHKRYTIWITSMSPYKCLFQYAVFLVTACLCRHGSRIVSASKSSLIIQLSSVHFIMTGDKSTVFKTSFWFFSRNVKAPLMGPIMTATFLGPPLSHNFSPVCVHPV